MKKEIKDCEDNKSSRRLQGKRVLATYKECKIELKNEIQLLFSTYNEALNKANLALLLFPIQSRSRNLEASIMQSCFADCLLMNFQGKSFFGKYKRLILRTNGYIILFKKLNNKGYPMNIKTASVQSILNQSQCLDLFAETDFREDPILYFGYQKNRIGESINPQIIYIDEGEIKFSIGESAIPSYPLNYLEDNTEEVKPKLKENNILKAAN